MSVFKKAKKVGKKKAPVAKAVKRLAVPRQAYYRNVGYGLTSYEGPDAVTGIRKGRLFTEIFDKGMDSYGEGEWIFDGGMGMRTYATLTKPEGFNVDL